MASRGGRTRVQTSTRTTDSEKPTREVLCPGHNRRAALFQANTQANKGRWFYTCPLGKDDKDRCKFFKWADDNSNQAPSVNKSPAKPTGGHVLGGGNVLGTGSPKTTPASAGAKSLNLPTTPTHLRASSIINAVNSRMMEDDPIEVPDSDSEIDWANVDTEAIEKDAEVRATPRTSQISATPDPLGAGADGVQARLEAAATGKRKREGNEEGDEKTPKRGTGNPFLTTPGTGTSVTPFETPAEGRHPALGPLLLAIPEMNEHLLRADRRVRAAESMKKSMRATIKNLQDRVKELEEELARRG